MGLDMYLYGDKFKFRDWENPENNETEDGFEVQLKRLNLGYWRKHPDLHGYIVRHFGDGVGDCSEILLDEKKITRLIKAVEQDNLPRTEGFFFGESLPEYKEHTIQVLNGALKWLQDEQDKCHKTVIYQASW